LHRTLLVNLLQVNVTRCCDTESDFAGKLCRGARGQPLTLTPVRGHKPLEAPLGVLFAVERSSLPNPASLFLSPHSNPERRGAGNLNSSNSVPSTGQ
jgi:hypothetical protein